MKKNKMKKNKKPLQLRTFGKWQWSNIVLKTVGLTIDT